MSDRVRRITTVNKIMVFISLGLVAIFIISCGGSGGKDDAGAGAGSGTAIFPPVVFMADKDTNGTVELYASFEDGTDIIKLSETMNAGGNVVDFRVSPDGIWVAYVADQDVDGKFELYVVPVDKASDESAVKVSVPLAGIGLKERSPGSGDYLFAWAPDSSRVAYIADADDSIANLFELFSSNPSGSDKALISELVDPNSDVVDFQWEPDSTLLAYVADQDTVGELELYVVPADGNGASVSVSGSMVGNGIKEDPVGSGEYAFSWAPDSSFLAYIADQLLQDKFELFTTTPDGITNRLISGPFDDGRDVEDFAWAPDSKLVAYTANQNLVNAIDLYTAPPDSTASSQINSSGMGSGQAVITIMWAPNSSRIGFISDKGVTGFFRLYTVQAVNNNDILVSGGLLASSDVTEFDWSPDSSLIAYLVDAQDIELYTTFPTSGSSTQIGDLSIFGGDVLEFEWAPDSSRIAYTADHDTTGVFELFSSTPDNDDTNQVSGSLVSGGDVGAFNWATDSSGVGYIADQDTDTVDELYASKPKGSDNTKLSGRLVNGGDVVSFEWVP